VSFKKAMVLTSSLNNSVQNKPILIILGTQHPVETSDQKI